MVQKHPITFITFLLFLILTITNHYISSGLKIPIRAKRSTLSIHERDIVRGASLTPSKLYTRGPTEFSQDTVKSMTASAQRLTRRALIPEAFRAATASALEPMNLAGEEGKLSYLATGFDKPIKGSSKVALPFDGGMKHSNMRISNQVPTSFPVQKFYSTGSLWVARSTSVHREQIARQLMVSQALASH